MVNPNNGILRLGAHSQPSQVQPSRLQRALLLVLGKKGTEKEGEWAVSCFSYAPECPGDDKCGPCKNKRMKLPLLGMDGKEGLAPRRRPALRGQGVTLGSVWHLLSGESWLGAEGENHGS